MLTRNSFPRPDDLTDTSDPTVLYVRSYLLIRTLVGLLGILLPLLFIVGEAAYLRGGVHVRGSLSAYYHTSMRDIFVAGLCVTGFLLATYLSGQARTWDFWLSLVAGVAVIGVVFFPTTRPGLAPGDPRCGATPEPPGCSPIQQQLGERLVAGIHFACAVVFILSLAAIAFLFAYRARQYENNRTVAAVQRTCGWVIIAAVAGTIVGELADVQIWELTPLYLGEVASVWPSEPRGSSRAGPCGPVSAARGLAPASTQSAPRGAGAQPIPGPVRVRRHRASTPTRRDRILRTRHHHLDFPHTRSEAHLLTTPWPRRHRPAVPAVSSVRRWRRCATPSARPASIGLPRWWRPRSGC